MGCGFLTNTIKIMILTQDEVILRHLTLLPPKLEGPIWIVFRAKIDQSAYLVEEVVAGLRFDKIENLPKELPIDPLRIKKHVTFNMTNLMDASHIDSSRSI